MFMCFSRFVDVVISVFIVVCCLVDVWLMVLSNVFSVFSRCVCLFSIVVLCIMLLDSFWCSLVIIFVVVLGVFDVVCIR